MSKKKPGCLFDPSCMFVEFGRVCAHAIFQSGNCLRSENTLPTEFVERHNVYRRNNSGKMSGHAIEKFKKRHSSWRS